MATPFTNSAEGGSDGTAVTTGNSGGASGDAFSAITLSGTGAVTFETDAAVHDDLGYRSSGGASSTAYARATWTADAACEIVWYQHCPVAPSSTFQLAALRSASSAALGVNMASAGNFQAVNAAGSSVNNTSGSFTNRPGARYRFQLRGVKGTGTGDGTIELRVYLGDSTVPLHTYTSSAVNAGTADINQFRLGKVSTTTTPADIDWDSVRVYTGADADGSAKPWPFTAPDADYVDVVGEAQNTTGEAATAVDLAAGASITVGNHLIARIAVDNSGTNGAEPGLTVTDDAGNTWTVLGPANQDPGAASAGVTCYIAWCHVANAYSNGDDIDFTWTTGSPAAKSIVVEEWTGLDPTTPVAVAAVTSAGASTTPSVGITPLAAGQLVYAALAVEGPPEDAYTPDGDSTDGTWAELADRSTHHATDTSNVQVRGAVKRVTGTTAQTWNTTITSRDWASLVVVLQPPADTDSVHVRVGGTWYAGTFWVKVGGTWYEAPPGA